MSKLEVDKLTPQSGTSLTLGDSGDTFTVPTGASFVATDELKTNKISPSSGTSFTFGDSGDTFTIPSGATIANSGTATGFGGGKINQVVQTILTSTTSSSSTSYVDVGMDITITPSAASSKVLLMFFPRIGMDTSSANIFMKVRNNTAGSDVTADPFIVRRWPSDGQSAYYTEPSPMVVMDSPNTSSAVQYKMQMKTNGGGFRVNQPANNGGYTETEVSTVIAMEVLA